MTTKIDLTNIADTALTTLTGPKVTTIVYPGDDTATDTAGGAVINLTGNGFQSGCSVLVASTASSVVSFINATQISFVAPALAAGTYVIYVINPDGGTAISIPGISYSGTPNWTTAAGTLGTAYETGAISATLAATGDAPISYSLATGTLPPGSTLNSNGTLSGTAQATASATTYSFTIKASDAQNQDTNRAFSITINPDVVTFNTPAVSTTYNVSKDVLIANVAMSATSAAGGSITYTADTLPTGLSISGANIQGTPTVVASTTTVLTATATSTRSATRTINWVVTLANDTFWKNTTLLLNGETSVIPFISDASTNNLALTINGDTKATRFSPYTAAYYSEVISANNSTTIPNNAAFQFGTGNFTVEFWVKSTSGAGTILAQATNAAGNWAILVTSGNLYWQSGYQTASLLYFAYTLTGSWTHIAYVRNSGTLNCYINGALAGTISDGTTYNGTGDLKFSPGGYGAFIGSVADVRIVKGTAVYTNAFSPPTAPLTAIAGTSLLISSASPTVVDTSTNNFTITTGTMTVASDAPYAPPPNTTVYGSAYFDGTGDYLKTQSSSGLAFGTGDFTIECWVYMMTGADANASFFTSTPEASFNGVIMGRDVIGISGPSGVGGNIIGVTLATNTWIHVALTRAGTSMRVFVNGALSGSATNSTTINSTLGTIGSRYVEATGYLWTGYISDFRVIKGTALYTTNFTPPTSPLTAVANTSLLTLQYNGGANNSGIIDNSSFNNIVTRFGNTSQGTFSPYAPTGWSAFFNGTSDRLSVATGTVTIGTSTDYTIEAWVYITGTTGSDQFISTGQNNGVGFGISNSLNLRWNKVNIGGGNTSTGTLSLNQWTHVALCRASGTVRFWINGVLAGANADTTSFSSTSTQISGSASAFYVRGYISNYRQVVGTALYTSAFNPPTAPLTPITNTVTLCCQSNRFVDNSATNGTITLTNAPTIQAFSPFGSISEAIPLSYSNYFDGTGDYLTVPTNAAFQLGTGSYTFETWIYPTALGVNNTNTIINIGTYITGLMIRVNGTSTGLQVFTNNTERLATSTGLVANTWQHIALVRDGTTCTVYINGVVNGTFTDPSSISPATATITTGMAAHNSAEFFTGYMSNYRLVKDTAVYTSAFTPPTTPLTAIANTSLLTCQSTTFKDNSTNNFAITAFGNTVPRQFNPFGYTAQSSASYTPSVHGGSAYFDGNGDYLNAATSTNFGFSNGDFTIDFWVYPTVNARQDWVDITDGTNRVLIYYSGSAITFYSVPGTAIVTGPAMVLNSWQHIAASKNSGSSRLFINGVQVGSTYTTNQTYSATMSLTIGKDAVGSTHVTGYMSDVRIIKGTGLYTSNFLPPATPLTSLTSTPASLLLNFTNGGIIDQHSTNVLETVGNTQLSTSVKKYNNSSIYFDGSGDCLTTTKKNELSPGSGDFTIEFWVYPSAIKLQTFFSQLTTTTSVNPHIYMDTLGTVNYYTGGSVRITGNAITVNNWSHIAVSRSSGSTKLFINGTQVGSTYTDTNNYVSPAYTNVGQYMISDGTLYSSEWFNGYIDDLRITKGVARYTGNFTAPTSAFITK